MRPDCYFSVDVEADGPVPSPYSMLSFGMVKVGEWDGQVLTRPPEEVSFYRELRPTGTKFVPEALAVAGLDRDALMVSGSDPRVSMTECARWVLENSQGAKPVFAAYPLSFDWMFFYHYMVTFSEVPSPFGFSSALDMKSFYSGRTGALVSRSTKRSMPRHLLSKLPHTHNALDDAREQGELLANLLPYRPSLSTTTEPARQRSGSRWTVEERADLDETVTRLRSKGVGVGGDQPAPGGD